MKKRVLANKNSFNLSGVKRDKLDFNGEEITPDRTNSTVIVSYMQQVLHAKSPISTYKKGG